MSVATSTGTVPAAKAARGTGSGRLGQVAVEGAGPHPGTIQLARQPGGAVLGPHEQQGPARAPGELGGDRDLLGRLHDADLVIHPGGGGRGGATMCRTGSVR